MNVALWAEIRRLTEIEKLSARAITRRLHCSWHTVAAAIASPQPPAQTARRRTSLLEPYLPQINDLLARYPELRPSASMRRSLADRPAIPAV